MAGGYGCPDFKISGFAAFDIAQIGTSYDVNILLQNADVITTEMCVELGRGDSQGEIVAMASGNVLTAAGGLTATRPTPGTRFAALP